MSESLKFKSLISDLGMPVRLGLFQHRLVKFVPIVEIVQVHCILGRGRVIGQTARAQNIFARFDIVIIAARGGVMLLDRLRVERLRVLLHPRFELGIGRLVFLDVILDRLFIEPERGASHRIESSADAGITGSEFTRRFEGDFLPEPRKMQNAEWTGNAGADQWNVGVAHNLRRLMSQRREDNPIRSRP